MIFLLVWYVIGLISSLFTFACGDKTLYGYWQITIETLCLSFVMGIAGPIMIMVGFIVCVKWYIEENMI
ncbi:hypothetical protein [Halocella sp. SP3-1]|uniref:hypothetical protein n=1 Tax=Halocella sp. SP3-1 TaxID=2382161 RepID=UPI000F764752|nr:hypothetical protein [Halocella sp. SP3-1]AZO96147.1 hypothetical protein D7D81_16975 [Halocella sp. SP3-1]